MDGKSTFDDIIKQLEDELEIEFNNAEERKELKKQKPVKTKVQKSLTGVSITTKKGQIDMRDDFWNKVEIESGEFPPWFKIQNGITYRFKLVDPNKEPRPHKDKTFNRDQWIWDVVLIDISPESALKEVDKNGNQVYVKGRTYSLALGKRAMQRFRTQWEAMNFDLKEFTMKRTGSQFQTDYIFGA